MENPKMSRKVFFFTPLALIGCVFTITGIFSFFLGPLMRSIPLMLTYYTFIWGSVLIYQKKYRQGKPLLAFDELKPSYLNQSWWMLVWNIAYPALVGTFFYHQLVSCIPVGWIILGLVFSLINGPSEEIFWRLFLENAGHDGHVSKRLRLWYASIIFSSWHFVFVVFLFPPQLRLQALISTLISTFIAGLLWMLVYQKSKNLFPNMVAHTVLNIMMIWPSIVVIVLNLPCAGQTAFG